MNLFNSTSDRKQLQDVVGLDFGSTCVKAVRLKRGAGDQLILAAAEVFPLEAGGAPSRPGLGKTFGANYVALALSAPTCVVRIVAHTGSHGSSEVNRQVRDQIGLDESYRLASLPSGQATKGKNENRVLAVAVPEKDAKEVLNLFQDGAPAPCSLEISGLASLNAALSGPLVGSPDAPVCLLDCGSRVSMMVFMNKGAIILARKLDVGGDAVMERVQKHLGVEREMADSIISEGAIDISQAVRDVIDPFLRQMMISRDFVERQENCRVATTCITGGMSMSSYWVGEIRKGTGMNVQTWDPLVGLTVLPGAIPEKLQGQQFRFTAAIGAARGALSAS
jgi:Tfp pilus assembly PilM family ATPase